MIYLVPQPQIILFQLVAKAIFSFSFKYLNLNLHFFNSTIK